MVKITREGENLRRSTRLTSSASPKLKEEEKVVFASQACSSGPMKGDASVDPTERPNSKSIVSSQQPILTQVVSAATENSGRQLLSSAITIENRVACMKSTSIDGNIACYIYTYSPRNPHISPTNLPPLEQLKSGALLPSRASIL